MRAPHKDTDTDFQELPSSANIEIQPNTPAEESMEDIKLSMEEISGSDKIVVDGNDEKPAISQYWELGNQQWLCFVISGCYRKRPVYGPVLWADYKCLSVEG